VTPMSSDAPSVPATATCPSPPGWLRVTAFTLPSVTLAIVAHLAAGGTPPNLPLVALLMGTVGILTASLRPTRRRLPQVIVGVVAVQVGVHVALLNHHQAALAAPQPGGPGMLLAHAAAALALAWCSPAARRRCGAPRFAPCAASCESHIPLSSASAGRRTCRTPGFSPGRRDRHESARDEDLREHPDRAAAAGALHRAAGGPGRVLPRHYLCSSCPQGVRVPTFRPTHLRLARRGAVASALAAAAVLLLAGPASAHVTVGADDTARGADNAILTIRVPTEEDNSVTTKIDIKFPTKNPIASVKPAPKPGWTVSTKTIKFNPPIKTDDGIVTDGVGEVVYTATSNANGIPVGGFEAFQILVGPLPDAADVAFPTVQTYSNGKTVGWVEPITDHNNPPDNPAPVLSLTAASADTGQATAGSAAPTATASAGTSSTESGGSAATNTSAQLSNYATTSDANNGQDLRRHRHRHRSAGPRHRGGRPHPGTTTLGHRRIRRKTAHQQLNGLMTGCGVSGYARHPLASRQGLDERRTFAGKIIGGRKDNRGNDDAGCVLPPVTGGK
jgi:periplasmic copper chaperone A